MWVVQPHHPCALHLSISLCFLLCTDYPSSQGWSFPCTSMLLLYDRTRTPSTYIYIYIHSMHTQKIFKPKINSLCYINSEKTYNEHVNGILDTQGYTCTVQITRCPIQRLHCSAVVQWTLSAENGVPIAIGQPEYICNCIFIRFYVIGTSSFHDICAAFYTYINVGLTEKRRNYCSGQLLHYTTAHDCLLCMHPHKGCNMHISQSAFSHCDFYIFLVTITPITRR